MVDAYIISRGGRRLILADEMKGGRRVPCSEEEELEHEMVKLWV